MALDIAELYGYGPTDESAQAREARDSRYCPFIERPCTKTFNDNTSNGVCTLLQKSAGPVICCPNRLYSDGYGVLRDIAVSAFGEDVRLAGPTNLEALGSGHKIVVVFGRWWGKELSLPGRGRDGKGGFVDWVLALVDDRGELMEFVAVEIQSMDTTGSYKALRNAYMAGNGYQSVSAGINWRNVFKRILPQLIYKGHILHREKLCKSGLFFVCPSPVYRKIMAELSDELEEYHRQPGSLTFKWYNLAAETRMGMTRDLVCEGEFTSTVSQVAQALSGQKRLPPAGVYEQAIRVELQRARKSIGKVMEPQMDTDGHG
jgi:hypothetical protein